MKDPTPEQSNRMTHGAILILGPAAITLLALLFITQFPAIAPAIESFMDFVRTYKGYGQ